MSSPFKREKTLPFGEEKFLQTSTINPSNRKDTLLSCSSSPTSLRKLFSCAESALDKDSHKTRKSLENETEGSHESQFLFLDFFLSILEATPNDNLLGERNVFLLGVCNSSYLSWSLREFFDEEMRVISRKIVKNHRNKLRFLKTQITTFMSCSSELTSEVTVISHSLFRGKEIISAVQQEVAAKRTSLSSSVQIISLFLNLLHRFLTSSSNHSMKNSGTLSLSFSARKMIGSETTSSSKPQTIWKQNPQGVCF